MLAHRARNNYGLGILDGLLHGGHVPALGVLSIGCLVFQQEELPMVGQTAELLGRPVIDEVAIPLVLCR